MSSLRPTVREARRGTFLFFVLAYGWSWLCWAAALLLAGNRTTQGLHFLSWLEPPLLRRSALVDRDRAAACLDEHLSARRTTRFIAPKAIDD